MVDITLSNIIGYVFGIIAVLSGLAYTFTSAVAAALRVAAGGVALPPVRRQLRDRAGLNFSRASVVGLVLVLSVASLGALVMAADSSDGGGPGSEVSNVTIEAIDAEPRDATQSLNVTWNARAQSAVDPDTSDVSNYQAEDGNKFVVVRVQLTNAGENEIDLTPRLFGMTADGVGYDYQALFGSGQGGLDVSLQQNASYDGWVVFEVPEDTSNAELTVNQDAYAENTTVRFTQNENLPVNVSA